MMKWFPRARLFKLVSVITIGIVIQAGGCAIDSNALMAQWATSIANTFLTDYAFDLVNATEPFSF